MLKIIILHGNGHLGNEGNNTFLYSVSTYIDSTASLIDADIFKQIIRSNPQFASKISNILNENTAQVYGRFYALTCKQSHGRVADILLCLSYISLLELDNQQLYLQKYFYNFLIFIY